MALKVNLSEDFQVQDETIGQIEEGLNSGWKSFTILSNGDIFRSDSLMKVALGPVIGEVTKSSANIVIEVKVQESNVLQCQLFKEDETIEVKEEKMTDSRPHSFLFEDLDPDTWYRAIFPSIQCIANFKTKPSEIQTFKLIALSCDKPSRLLMGQLNPWKFIEKTVNTGRVDSVLHIGDQIYPDGENMANSEKIFAQVFDEMSEEKQTDMMNRGREIWRQKYRSNFNKPYKREVLRKASNLMIWSDNDVANDFTTRKTESGDPAYHSKFLTCGMETYRDYQRRLWDPHCSFSLEDQVQEWHCHVYDKVGIFMFDLRGNRITCEGGQESECPLISTEQWEAFEEFMANPDLRAIMLCSETPFVGDEPGACKETVESNPKLDFLRDHWSFNEEELTKLVEICFSWKSGDPDLRDLIFIAGDIHCGVTSVLTDEETGLQINHYTTSPVTNHVCDFFSPLSGAINDRFHFSHLPLGKKFRNFLEVDIRFEDECTNIQAKLVPISNDIFKNPEWHQD